jgi:O-antigen ligase
MSTAAAAARTVRQPFVDGLFFATVATVTFEKVHWSVGGDLALSDVLTFLFLVAFALSRLEHLDGRFTRSAAITFAFFLAFLAVYLIGFFNLDTATALAQWAKGMVKFVLHFGFLFAAVALVARRGERFFWWTLTAFCGGIVFNVVYGIVQLGVAQTTGANLDAAVLSPITRGASQINIYGAVEGANVYRPNGITGDPNHLAIELLVPLLILLPIYLRLEKGHRLRWPLMLTLMLLFLVELATFSRSGLLGLFFGLLVLAVPYRHLFLRARFLVPLGAVFLVIGVIVSQRAGFFETVLRTRVDTSGRGTSTHFVVYEFIPNVLSQHPLFGLGLNNFSVYYEFVTGRNNFGPHSFYVALFVESGLVGALLFLAFLGYVFVRLSRGRAIGRALSGAGDGFAAARVRPLEWGMTAALVATMASNFFYLTMSFYYFFVFAMLAIVAPAVFVRRLRPLVV